ncbi:MAG TPA: TerC/Alx family metal homeostasis membrane protein [Thermoleophilaceae bacterium]|nr:TerC/Alx family metal homeostasis membrane protein [Thermoleophilaceae bacterium]
MDLAAAAPWAALVVAVLVLLAIDLRFFARGRDPNFREGAVWSVGWLVLSLLVALAVWALGTGQDAVLYTTVYLIERSLSLDNLFVFLMLFAYFAVPVEHRARLLFWGIVAALLMRGLAILAGTALIEQLHFVIYILGALLLVLAYRILRGVGDSVDPESNLVVRGVRKVFPVTRGFRDGHWFAREDGRRHVTPLFLCLVAIVAADLAFAVDSIPAAFAVTRDPLLIWTGNVFALLGLRALFVLVEGLIRRFRYLDQTIAVVLGAVAVKLLLEDVVPIGPIATLAGVGALFAIGIVASLVADRRDPDIERKREERAGRTGEGRAGDDGGPADDRREGQDGQRTGDASGASAPAPASGP